MFKIFSDNGTEFKNRVLEQVTKELGVDYKLYTLPYYPASNSRIEGFHAFLKACISKHVAPQIEWDVLVPLACAAYNFMPNKHSKESPFFLMFGRDPVLPLNTINRRTNRNEAYKACKIHISCRLIYKTNTQLFSFWEKSCT